ncbi:MAG: DUF4189 domain-containing protein [Pseudolabrys sp.]
MLRLLRAATLAALFVSPSLSYGAGAIAVDDEAGEATDSIGYGSATGYGSREEAGVAAMQQCRAEGNRNCRVVVRFDTCGAYAVSRGHFGVGWGSTAGEARAMALDACGANCRVAIAECE